MNFLEENGFIKEFLNDGEDFNFGIINEVGIIYNKEEIEKILKDLGTLEILDTYFEQIIFKAKDEEIYELGYL